MRVTSVGEVKDNFRALLNEAERGQRFLIQRHGKPVAALVPVSDVGIEPEKMQPIGKPFKPEKEAV